MILFRACYSPPSHSCLFFICPLKLLSDEWLKNFRAVFGETEDPIYKNGIMYQRAITIPQDKSFFLFGPRGTGKTTWVKNIFPSALYIDLLEAETYNELLVNPEMIRVAFLSASVF